jgi:hypothetical protein
MPADSGRGNEEGSWAQARRLSEQLLWLWVAAILYPQGLCLGLFLGLVRRSTRPYPLGLCASAMVVSGKGPQVVPAPGPLQDLELLMFPSALGVSLALGLAPLFGRRAILKQIDNTQPPVFRFALADSQAAKRVRTETESIAEDQQPRTSVPQLPLRGNASQPSGTGPTHSIPTFSVRSA